MKRSTFLRLASLLGIFVSLAAFQPAAQKGVGTGQIMGYYSIESLIWLGLALLSTLISLAGLVFASIHQTETWLEKIDQNRRSIAKSKVSGLLLAALIGTGVFLAILLSSAGTYFNAFTGRLLVLWWVAVMGGLVSLIFLPVEHAWQGSVCALLTAGVAARILTVLPEISSSPFTLGWSEGGLHWTSSLFWSQSIYGKAFPTPILDSGRFFIYSLPMLLPNLTIFWERVWMVGLGLAMNALAAGLLIRRLRIPERATAWGAAAWCFIFLAQGPIYFHLVLTVIPVLWGFDRRKPVRTLIIVLVSSVFAGLTRINWFPAPGVLAALLFLLEQPREKSPLPRYLLWPVIWAASGTGLAFLVQQIYMRLSGNPVELFNTSLKSVLLWFRLLPNTTYPEGVIWAAAVVVLPPLALVFSRLLANPRSWNGWRTAGVLAVLGVFGAGGIVVSAKIGGGSNLHNLDAFIFFLAVITAYLAFDRYECESESTPGAEKTAWKPDLVIATAVLLIPVALAANQAKPLPDWSETDASAVISQLQSQIDSVGDEPVLVIHNPQLVTYHLLSVPNLVPEYEKVTLMEMAMVNNTAYLDQFENDLINHRFGLIITEPLTLNIQDWESSFAAENNAWIKYVNYPLTENYQPVLTIPELGIVVMKPNLQP